ncbi:DUF1298 domain-containing protein [Frankia sp. CN7]|uniref:DUF1298 domain-containing protein n=2 Tax=Frankia nepalensis TaxID=1836974 RepID=A0A937UUR7_9ACTN|nr:DUF1298 domain-containing protein [Frankia nepalensis]MBL7511705.1 DUF1298 domain-containing protein [Frankia nepalensis]MBL7632535.1 DUF1298 domain-containing protein [Frankia nepalensis]
MFPEVGEAGNRPLSRMDAALLGYQRKNPAAPVTVAYLLRAEGRCDLAAARTAVAERARRFPALTHRVRHSAGSAAWPVWTADPRLDAAARVREHRVHGGAEGRRAFVERWCRAVLPPDAPPWEICLLRGGDPESTWVLFRASHVWLDGTALHLALTMLFGDGDATAGAPPRWSRAGRVSPRAKAAAFGRLLGWMPPTGGLDALARPSSGRGRTCWATTDVERLRALGRAYGGTVNDVFLVALSGALDGWSRPSAGRRPVRALMPVGVRRPDERAALGNFVVGARVELPLGVASPWRRFEAVRRQTSRYRGDADVAAGERWWFEKIPTRLGPASVASGMDPGRVTVTTSNLGTLPGPLALAGHPFTEALPVPVLLPGQRLFVILGGLSPTASLGVTADANVPGAAALPRRWLAELAALEHAAGLPTIPEQTAARVYEAADLAAGPASLS